MINYTNCLSEIQAFFQKSKSPRFYSHFDKTTLQLIPSTFSLYSTLIQRRNFKDDTFYYKHRPAYYSPRTARRALKNLSPYIDRVSRRGFKLKKTKIRPVRNDFLILAGESKIKALVARFLVYFAYCRFPEQLTIKKIRDDLKINSMTAYIFYRAKKTLNQFLVRQVVFFSTCAWEFKKSQFHNDRAGLGILVSNKPVLKRGGLNHISGMLWDPLRAEKVKAIKKAYVCYKKIEDHIKQETAELLDKYENMLVEMPIAEQFKFLQSIRGKT